MRNFWDYCIKNEHDILREIKNAIDDPGNRTEGGGRSGISNPTEAIAMRELTMVVKEITINGFFVIKYPQKVIRAIRYVRASINMNEELGSIYKARYIDKEPWRDTCKRMKISSETYNKRVRKITEMCDKYRKKMRGMR